MRVQQTQNRKNAGFTLIEVLTVTAIIGVLVSVALPSYQNFMIQARVSEGVLLISELVTRVGVDFNQNGTLGTEIPPGPTPDGEVFGGPFYKYETLFGRTDDMWDQIEYLPKGPHRVIALRAHRKPEWDNSDIGIHFQIKLMPDNTLAFRCTVNDILARMEYVPASCRDGDSNDWTSW